MFDNKLRKFFLENGYLHFPGFYSHDRVDRVQKLHEQVWQEKRSDIVVDHMISADRMRLSEVPTNEDRGPFKLNDLYLKYDESRNLALSSELVSVLEGLMVDKPVLINSLDVDYGTQQDMHIDSLFMTPPTPENLCAAWIALEDGRDDSGPLEYYPGSHFITPYKFSTGSNHVVPSEMKNFQEYIYAQIEYLGLKKQRLIPKKGDVFIWHSYLLHGGSKRQNMDVTRKSSIFHYFTKSAASLANHKLVEFNGAYYSDRLPLYNPQISRPDDEIIGAHAASSKASLRSRFENIARTSIHCARQWSRDVLRIIRA